MAEIHELDLPGRGGRKVSQAELAEFVGVAPKTLWTWQAWGLPFAVGGGGDGRTNSYDTASVAAWLYRQGTAVGSRGETPRDRLFRLQADKLELEIREKDGSLVDISKLGAEMCGTVRLARDLILMIPDRLSSLLDASTRSLVRDEIEAALRELAAIDPADPTCRLYDPRTHQGGRPHPKDDQRRL